MSKSNQKARENSISISLADVHNVVKKWLYIPNLERVDIILATAISLHYKGNPLWVFIVGNSGDGKTEIIRALEGLPHTRKIDQLTANTLASGRNRKVGHDLGAELQNTSTILIFSDLACLTSLNKDEKKKIWGQFRNLYDGEIYKDTGERTNIRYTNCHVVIIACTTSTIKDEFHIHQQLGTREFLYSTEANPEDDEHKMRRAIDNLNKQEEMRQELKQIIQGFITTHRFNDSIEISPDIMDYIIHSCLKLKLLRATGPTDWYSGELSGDAECEIPTRLISQFATLYKSLKSLDKKYPDTSFKNIVENIIKTSSQPVRYKLYNIFKKQPDEWLTIPQLQQKTRLGRKAIISQCELLWNLRSLNKEIREELVGSTGVYVDRDNIEHPKGGHMEKVAYYRAEFTKKKKGGDRR